MLGVGDGGNGGREFCDKNIESVLLRSVEDKKRKSYPRVSRKYQNGVPSNSPPLN